MEATVIWTIPLISCTTGPPPITRRDYASCQLPPKSQSMWFVTVIHNSAFHNDAGGSLQAFQAVYFQKAVRDQPQRFGA